jgi:hypothetical protein
MGLRSSTSPNKRPRAPSGRYRTICRVGTLSFAASDDEDTPANDLTGIVALAEVYERGRRKKRDSKFD